MIWPNGAGSAFALGFDMDGDTIWKIKSGRFPTERNILKDRPLDFME